MRKASGRPVSPGVPGAYGICPWRGHSPASGRRPTAQFGPVSACRTTARCAGRRRAVRFESWLLSTRPSGSGPHAGDTCAPTSSAPRCPGSPRACVLITAHDPDDGPRGEDVGMTATAFMSVSLDPPLVLVSVRIGSRMDDLLEEQPLWAVSVLAESQRHIAGRFAMRGRISDRLLFEDIPLLPRRGVRRTAARTARWRRWSAARSSGCRPATTPGGRAGAGRADPGAGRRAAGVLPGALQHAVVSRAVSRVVNRGGEPGRGPGFR